MPKTRAISPGSQNGSIVNDVGKQTERLKMGHFGPRACPSDSLTATSLVGQILTVRYEIGHQRCAFFFLSKVFCRLKFAITSLASSSYRDTGHYRGNVRRIST